MPARQASLTSFFGAPPGSKPPKVQSTLSFGGKKKTTTTTKTTSRGAKEKKEKAVERPEAKKKEEESKEEEEEQTEPETSKAEEGPKSEHEKAVDGDAKEGRTGAVETGGEEEEGTTEGSKRSRRDDPQAKDDAEEEADADDGIKTKGGDDAAADDDDLVDTDEEEAAADEETAIATLGKKGGKTKRTAEREEAPSGLRGKRRRRRKDGGGDESGGMEDVVEGGERESPPKKAKAERKGGAGKGRTKAVPDGMSDEEEEEYEEEVGDDDDEEEEEDDLMADTDEDEPTESVKNGGKGSRSKAKKKSTPEAAKSKRMVDEVLKRPPKSSTSNVSGSSGASGAGKKKSEVVASETKSDADLLKDITWKDDSPIPYLALCETFEHIESISSRLDIQRCLTELFRKVLLKNEKDLYDLIYLADNSVAPAYECVELGVGDSILIKAIGEASGTNPGMVKSKYESEGDLGTVAQIVKGKQRTLGFGVKPKPLTAKEVLSVFRQIATTSGAQSQKWKTDKIKGLLVRARGPESKYVIRGLQGKLRIGLAQSSVLVSLAHAVRLTTPKGVEEEKEKKKSTDEYPPDALKLLDSSLPLDVHLESAASVIKKAYSEVPSYDALLDAALSKPLTELHAAVSLTPGIPVAPMLAKPTKSVQEVLKRLSGSKFTCEYKYDGERAQVHMTPDGTTKVFSRSLLDTSEKFPEVPLYVKEARRSSTDSSSDEQAVSSFVLDAEVVAYNRETKQFVPFQILSTRKKTEESAESAKVQVIVQAFDLMYLNGVSLLDKPLSKRRELLRENFVPVDGKFQFATSIDVTEEDDGDNTALEEFLETAVKNQCEGLMVKTLDSNANYEPSKRSLNWLKLKKDYLEGLGDSVDLVPLGAYHGRGKRTGVYGAYLLACYDVDTEDYQSVCKIGTGFSEEDLQTLASGLNERLLPAKPSQYDVSDALTPDVWFDSCQVWEVKAADLSKSSAHRGASGKIAGEVGRGIGLRFPRFERVRTDKKPEQATTSDQILDMYYAQDSVVDDGGNGGGADDDDGI